MSKKKIIKIVTVITILASVFGTAAGISMIANASWANILACLCTVTNAFIAMGQLLLVKEAYKDYIDPDDEE